MTNAAYGQYAPMAVSGQPAQYAPMAVSGQARLAYEPTERKYVMEERPAGPFEVMRAKLMHSISIIEAGSVGIEEDSIYGAAILMPQVARTLGWPKEFMARVVVTYVYLVVTVIIAGALLTYLSKEQDIMGKFSGQPFLCDFGVGMEGERPGPGGIGPAGTPITALRMYNFDQWNSRLFTRDALKTLFPHKAKEIEKFVDPGEFGTESHACKLVCCLVFMISILSEMDRVGAMLRLLWVVPNRNEDWLTLENGGFEESADRWLEHIRVQVAGMSIPWKLTIFFSVFVPKFCLFILTLTSGITFLMESASIATVIVNSTALGFLLNLDELIMSAVKTQAMEHLLVMCEEFKLYDVAYKARIDRASRNQAVEYFNQSDAEMGMCGFMYRLVPKQILTVMVLTAIFVAYYYQTHCVVTEDGRWVSRDMTLPKGLEFNFLNALLPNIFPVPEHEEPWWTMPKPSED